MRWVVKPAMAGLVAALATAGLWWYLVLGHLLRPTPTQHVVGVVLTVTAFAAVAAARRPRDGAART